MFVALSVIVFMSVPPTPAAPMPPGSDVIQLGAPLPAADPPPAPDPVVTILPGDTLSEIALEWGADLAAVIAANGISNPDLVLPGQQYRVPGGHQPPPRSSVTYRTAPETSATLVAARPGVAGVGNHFSFGYCTWYVANRRPVPWFGDAGQWGPNAHAMGFSEGTVPRPGAIMVTWEGPIGHVAYVESVNADGSWVVSEMNYKGWDVVDYRTVRPGTIPIETFIY